MKPVEIEFLMRDRLSGGLDNARLKATCWIRRLNVSD